MEWPLVRLDTLYDIARGGSPRPIKKFITDDPNGINWIKIGDATASGKYIYKTKEKIIPEGIQRSRLVKKGDFILSNSMSFGRPYIMGTSGCIHDGWLVLRSKNGQVDQDFLYYILGSPFVFQQFDSLAAGSTVRNLNIDLVSGVKIPVPPIPEQKRIVAILGQAFADIEQARAKTEQNLRNAHELFESYLQQVFSQLGNNCVLRSMADKAMLSMIDGDRGKNYPKKSDFLSEGHCLFLSTKNVRPDGFLFDQTMFIDEALDSLLRKGKLEKNDVILTTRGTIGNLALFDDTVNYEHVRINSGMLILRPNTETILPSYLFEIMRSGIVRRQIETKVSGAAQPQLPVTSLKTFSFPVPISLEDQQHVVEMIREAVVSINALTKIYEKKLTAIDELKKSILQKAFTGQLTHSVEPTEGKGAAA